MDNVNWITPMYKKYKEQLSQKTDNIKWDVSLAKEELLKQLQPNTVLQFNKNTMLIADINDVPVNTNFKIDYIWRSFGTLEKNVLDPEERKLKYKQFLISILNNIRSELSIMHNCVCALTIEVNYKDEERKEKEFIVRSIDFTKEYRKIRSSIREKLETAINMNPPQNNAVIYSTNDDRLAMSIVSILKNQQDEYNKFVYYPKKDFKENTTNIIVELMS